MNHKEIESIRQQAIEKLAEHGVWLSRTTYMRQIVDQVEKITGHKKPYRQLKSDYLARWLGMGSTAVNPRYQPQFKPMDPARLRHPRMADIHAGQPPLWTPNGIGNTKQPGGFAPMVWR